MATENQQDIINDVIKVKTSAPANCFGAPDLMEKKHFWDEVDLDDDEDLGAIIDLARAGIAKLLLEAGAEN